MKLLNIAKCRFIVTNIDEKKVEVKSGEVVDVDDKEAEKLTKIYPNAWKNLDISVAKPIQEKKEAKEVVKEDAPEAEEENAKEVEVSSVKKTSRKRK